jgi:hypothetical protein
MQRVLRIGLVVVVVGLVLHAADLATRDCRVAPYIYDDCMWLALRTRLGLPANRFLRMAALECVGVFLASVLYLTFRFVWPRSKGTRARPDPSAPSFPTPSVD